MQRVLALTAALAVIAALPGPAEANGRFPASTNVYTRPGDVDDTTSR